MATIMKFNSPVDIPAISYKDKNGEYKTITFADLMYRLENLEKDIAEQILIGGINNG